MSADPFAPPSAGPRPTHALIVPEALANRGPPELRDGLVRLARRPAEPGLPLVLVHSHDLAQIARAKGIVEELLGVTAEVVGPTDWPSLIVLVGGAAGSATLFGLAALGSTAKDAPTMLGIAALSVVGGLWAAWSYGPGATRRCDAVARAVEAAPRLDTLPEAPIAAAQALAAAGQARAALGLLGAVILAAPKGASLAREALLTAAALREAGGNKLMASRLRQRAAREAPAAERVAPAPLPWQADGLLVVPIAGGADWPPICPQCNQPGRHPVKLPLGVNRDLSPGMALLVILTGGVLLLLLFQKQGVPTNVWMCDAHHAVRQRATAAIVACVATILGSLVAAGTTSPWWLLVTIGALFPIFSALAWRSPLSATTRGDDRVWISGADPDFVRARPPAP